MKTKRKCTWLTFKTNGPNNFIITHHCIIYSYNTNYRANVWKREQIKWQYISISKPRISRKSLLNSSLKSTLKSPPLQYSQSSQDFLDNKSSNQTISFLIFYSVLDVELPLPRLYRRYSRIDDQNKYVIRS